MKVLVTSCTVNSALSIMRSLFRAGWDVIGTDKRRLPFGLHSRCTPPYELIGDLTSENFGSTLRRVIDRHRPDVLLPVGAARKVSQQIDLLRGSTEVLVPDFGAFDALDDKRLLIEQCEKSGILSPGLLDRESAERLLRECTVGAVVVKPRFNFGGGAGVNIVSTADDLGQVVERTERRFGETIVTEFVPGPDSDNIAIQVVFDRESRLIGHFSLQKLRLQPARVGVCAASVSVHRPDLLESVLPLFHRLRWRGPADIEFKIDSRTGQASLIEVNARFSGAVGFAIGCGVNLPLLACKATVGEELPESIPPTYRAGIKYWNPVMYARAVVTAAISGPARLGLLNQVRKELRGERIGSPYELSDPAPAIGKGLYSLSNWFKGGREESRSQPAPG